MGRNNQDLSKLESCERCQAVLDRGTETCSSCGAPTKYMSFKSRAEYEVEEWRRHKAQASAAS
jgi:predicted amidophosphoribosyltransferase